MATGEVELAACAAPNDWILIVDDESDITSIFRLGLMKKGFSVFGFTDPLLALEHFQLNQAKYKLVISHNEWKRPKLCNA